MKDRLVDLIKNSKDIIVFTGAGISVESGIPDFRSSTGLYTTGKFEGYNPEQILSRKFFITKPTIFYQFYKKRLLEMSNKKPNRIHYTLAEWEAKGIIKAIITQNIDNLHQTAGSKLVLDLHGNGSTVKCCVCLKKYPVQYMHDQLEEGIELPKCECGAKVRPNTVLFDEWLDDDIFDASVKVVKMSDLILCMGSSLLVQPAAGILTEKNKECKLVIINMSATPYDKIADLLIHEQCGDVLDYVKSKI